MPRFRAPVFTLQYEVDCPSDWRAWLVLENSQATQTANAVLGIPRPTPLSGYQIPLEKKGHARIPLDYLPTTPDGKNRMLASICEPKHSVVLLAKHQTELLSYQTERLVNVHAVIWLLHESETPDSITRRYGGPPFSTIKAPSRPQSAPFAASYEQGKIEIVRLTPHPSDGQIQWMPNGQPCTEQFLPDRGGRSSASDRVIKEITVRVLSDTREPSWPVLRFPEKSGFSGMGASFPSRHRAAARDDHDPDNRLSPRSP